LLENLEKRLNSQGPCEGRKNTMRRHSKRGRKTRGRIILNYLTESAEAINGNKLMIKEHGGVAALVSRYGGVWSRNDQCPPGIGSATRDGEKPKRTQG